MFVRDVQRVGRTTMTIHRRQLYMNVSLFVTAEIESDDETGNSVVNLKNVHETHQGALHVQGEVPEKPEAWREAVAVITAKEAMRQCAEKMGKDPDPTPEPGPITQLPPTGGASA